MDLGRNKSVWDLRFSRQWVWKTQYHVIWHRTVSWIGSHILLLRWMLKFLRNVCTYRENYTTPHHIRSWHWQCWLVDWIRRFQDRIRMWTFVVNVTNVRPLDQIEQLLTGHDKPPYLGDILWNCCTDRPGHVLGTNLADAAAQNAYSVWQHDAPRSLWRAAMSQKQPQDRQKD